MLRHFLFKVGAFNKGNHKKEPIASRLTSNGGPPKWSSLGPLGMMGGYGKLRLREPDITASALFSATSSTSIKLIILRRSFAYHRFPAFLHAFNYQHFRRLVLPKTDCDYRLVFKLFILIGKE